MQTLRLGKIFGWTPLFIAASEGFMTIVKLLKEYGASYDIVDDSGWLPMEHACLRGHLDVTDLLLPKNENYCCTTCTTQKTICQEYQVLLLVLC